MDDFELLKQQFFDLLENPDARSISLSIAATAILGGAGLLARHFYKVSRSSAEHKAVKHRQYSLDRVYATETEYIGTGIVNDKTGKEIFEQQTSPQWFGVNDELKFHNIYHKGGSQAVLDSFNAVRNRYPGEVSMLLRLNKALDDKKFEEKKEYLQRCWAL